MHMDARAGRARLPAPLRPVAKPLTVRCLGPVDAGELAARIDRVSDRAWHREDRLKPNRFPCFHHTRHIVFRFIFENRDPRRFYSTPAWRVWRAWLAPPMEHAAAVYGFARPIFPKAMLARLEAGRGITPHVDGGGSNPLVHKVHVPLRTDPRAVLTVGGESIHLSPGHAWEVNNLAPHGAYNGGGRDRIHLVFEVFEGAGLEVVEEVAVREVIEGSGAMAENDAGHGARP